MRFHLSSAVSVSDRDMVQAFCGYSFHLCGDRLIPISGEAIHTGSHKKASSGFLRGAE
jgi:hypothetical protein